MTESLKILLVEDQDDLRDLMVEMLSSFCLEVRTASEAEAALAVLRSGYDCDVLFSDVHMPGTMTGAELSQVVTRECTGVHVILSSGHAKHQLGALPDGVDFMQKPFRLNQLMGVLRRIGEERRG